MQFQALDKAQLQAILTIAESARVYQAAARKSSVIVSGTHTAADASNTAAGVKEEPEVGKLAEHTHHLQLLTLA